MNISEKRSSPRRAIDAGVTMHRFFSLQRFRVYDVSAGGACLLSVSPYPVGEHVIVELSLPHQETIDSVAVVRWCEVRAEKYLMGMEFVSDNAGIQSRLARHFAAMLKGYPLMHEQMDFLFRASCPLEDHRPVENEKKRHLSFLSPLPLAVGHPIELVLHPPNATFDLKISGNIVFCVAAGRQFRIGISFEGLQCSSSCDIDQAFAESLESAISRPWFQACRSRNKKNDKTVSSKK